MHTVNNFIKNCKHTTTHVIQVAVTKSYVLHQSNDSNCKDIIISTRLAKFRTGFDLIDIGRIIGSQTSEVALRGTYLRM